MKKRAWIWLVLMLAGTAIAVTIVALAPGTTPARYGFLKGAILMEDRVKAASGGALRRVQVFRTSTPYKSLLTAVQTELTGRPPWKLYGHGAPPLLYHEFHSPAMSVEIVEGVPLGYTPKNLGVSWNPAPKSPDTRTIYITTAAAWTDEPVLAVSGFFRSLFHR
jgi:hypothetical protein